MDQLVNEDYPVSQGYLDFRECLGNLERQVIQERKVLLDQPELGVNLDQLDYPACQVSLEKGGTMANR